MEDSDVRKDILQDTPLRHLVDQVVVLTLPIYPRREIRMRRHLTEDCGLEESSIHMYRGACDATTIDYGTERFYAQELSLWDLLSLHPSLEDAVTRNIAQNHLAMLRSVENMIPNATKWVLFLEDDARIDRSVFSPSQARHLRHLLEAGKVDVLHLGCMPVWWRSPVIPTVYDRPHVVRHYCETLMAHAYIMTRTGITRLLAWADDPSHPIAPYDRIFYRAGMTVRTAYPMIAYQCREPVLYRRTQMMMPLLEFCSLRSLCDFMMTVSLVMPIITIVFTSYIIWLSVTTTLRARRRRRYRVIKP